MKKLLLVIAMLAYNAASAKFESTDPDLEAFVTEPEGGGISFGGFLGNRHNFSDKFTGLAEVATTSHGLALVFV